MSRHDLSVYECPPIISSKRRLNAVESINKSKLETECTQELARIRARKIASKIQELICIGATLLTLAVLGNLLFSIFNAGISWLSFDFLSNFPSRFPASAGIKSALYGSFWLLLLTAAIAVPVGVGGAVFLEEIAPKGRIKSILDLNIRNLASVPSIIYGILGLALFVRYFHFNRSLLSGALTLSTLVLPTIIIASREALLSVPSAIRDAAMALGATRWEATRDHVIPHAAPGILTGVILAMSRVIGESAPLLLIGAMSYVAFVPEGPFDSFTALPIQIYNWAGRPQPEFQQLAAAAIIVLLVLLIGANAVAIFIRHRIQRKNICNQV